jgi:hypothetical protein
VLFDFNNGWLALWDRRANLDLILWDPHYSLIGAHFGLLRDFLFTGAKLDLYLYYKLGAPSLVICLLAVTALATLALRSALASEALGQALAPSHADPVGRGTVPGRPGLAGGTPALPAGEAPALPAGEG